MPVETAKQWFEFLNSAPDPFKALLFTLFWLLVALSLLLLIFRIIFNAKFKEFYSAVRAAGKLIRQGFGYAAAEVQAALMPAQPYPRLAKLSAIVFMLTSYCMFTFSLIIFFALIVASVLADLPPEKQLQAALITLIPGFFAWVFFNQAERDRLGLRAVSS